jgi:hypothetical protein
MMEFYCERIEEWVDLEDCDFCSDFEECKRRGYYDKIIKEHTEQDLSTSSRDSQTQVDTSDKKSAARSAAAKHSTDPMGATIEYARLTGQLDKPISTEKIIQLQQEMLSHLPLYRHPTNDKFAEYMLFFDPELSELGADIKVLCEYPQLLKDMEKDGVNEKFIRSVEVLVRENELKTIELAKSKSKLAELEERISAAHHAYKEIRGQGRYAAVVQALGLTNRKRGKVYDMKKVYFDYVSLVRKKGMVRRDAVKEVMAKHGFKTYGATIKALSRQIRLVKNAWEHISPILAPEIIKRLEGLVPQDREQ